MIEVETMQAAEASHHQISPSPSFSSYSSETLAEIAARVIEELRRGPHSVSDVDETLFESWENDNFTAHDQPYDDHQRHDSVQNDDVDADENDDDDFEFAFVSRDENSSQVSADDIFYNGQIRPMYPIFDRNLLFGDDGGFASTPVNDGVVSNSPISNTNNEIRRHRLPLRKLMFEERETASCSSSTSEDSNIIELDGVAEGTYCVWNPRSAVAVDSMGRQRKKSSSTGSASKRWKIRDLLLRSHSEGKDPVVFHQKRTNKVAQVVPKHNSADNNGGAMAEHDGQLRTKEGDQKRKSFLPVRHVRQELVGLFSNINGLGRNLHPF